MTRKILGLVIVLTAALALMAQTNQRVGSLTVTGTSKLARIFNECSVDSSTYTTIAGAYGDTANCKSVLLPPGYTETLAANLVLNRNSVPIICEASCTLNLGTFQITRAGTINGTFIGSPYCGVTNAASTCFTINYTGTAAALVIGDSVTHSSDFYMRGVQVITSGNGAIGLQLNNLDEFEIVSSKFTSTGGTSPIGVVTNGTGQFVGVGKFDHVQVIQRGTNSIGYQFQTLSSHIQIIGGNLDLDAGANAVCFDVQGPSTNGIELMNPNANTCNTAVKVEASDLATGGITGVLRIDSGVVSVASFATGTVANKISCNNCATNATYTDTGTNNSVEFPILNQVQSRYWTVGMGAPGFFSLTDRTDGITFLSKQANAAMQLNSGAGNPLRFNSGSSGATGFEFWGLGAAVLVGDQNGTLHPAVAGAIGLGITALPYKNLIVGGSAANATTWQPVVSAARNFITPDGNSSSVMPFSFTTTAATTDNVAVTGMTASGHCTLQATNSTAAAGLTSVFVSAKASNQITVTHTATAGWTFDGHCTSN